jgi:hypothetical protein
MPKRLESQKTSGLGSGVTRPHQKGIGAQLTSIDFPCFLAFQRFSRFTHVRRLIAFSGDD